MKRKLVIAGVVVILMAGVTTVLWTALDWPPPRLVLEYGFPPTEGPTGKKLIIEGVKFVELGAGYFRMGSEDGYGFRSGDLLGRVSSSIGISGLGTVPRSGSEGPLRWVEIPRPFWISTTEVTRASYSRHNRQFQFHSAACLWLQEQCTCARLPVIESWTKAIYFCSWIASRAPPGFRARLPTDAEWEYACRAGSTSRYFLGDLPDELHRYAIFGGGSANLAGDPTLLGPSPVAGKCPNPWGLFDVYGNSVEWCQESFTDSCLDAPSRGHAGIQGATSKRILRGGAWCSGPRSCTSTSRGSRRADEWNLQAGFRVVLFCVGN
jgi:formylglycine-generating enzyme required for sulfatase activity